MKPIFLSALLLTAICTNTFAEFPAEEIWHVDFDTTATVLGPSWEEDGQWYFLVGLTNKAVIVSEGEVVWESGDIGIRCQCVNRFDSNDGNGHEIIIAGDRSVVRLSGEDYSQSNIVNGFLGFGLPIIYIPSIGQYDSLRSIYILCDRPYSHSDGDYTTEYRAGVVKQVLQDTIIYVRDLNGAPSLAKTLQIDNSESLLLFNVYSEEYYREYNYIGGIYTNILTLLESNTEILLQHQFQLVALSLVSFNNINGVCYISARDGGSNSFILSLNTENLGIIHQRQLPQFITYPRTYEWKDLFGDESILALGNNKAFLIDPITLNISDFYDFDITYLSATTGNFDEDDDFELAILLRDGVTLYDIGPLSVSPSSFIPQPSSFALIAAYPNPFNSMTTVEYALPHAGKYTITVHDLTGREITRLADGWNTAGNYRAIWDATGIPSGAYMIRLAGDGQNSVRQVEIVK